MNSKYIETLKRHISTHGAFCRRPICCKLFRKCLNPEGRINAFFASDDKWPNHDGTFEYVSNPDKSRRPEQNFNSKTIYDVKKDITALYGDRRTGMP